MEAGLVIRDGRELGWSESCCGRGTLSRAGLNLI